MIISNTWDGTWLFTQGVHAFLCGQLARRWTYRPLEPMDEMLVAATYHEAGWVELDQQPRVNAKFQPQEHFQVDLADQFLAWDRTINRLLVMNRYSVLVVLQHAIAAYERRLHTQRDKVPSQVKIRNFIASKMLLQTQLQRELAAQYGELVKNPYLQHNREVFEAWDWMSILLLRGESWQPHRVEMGTPPLGLRLEMNPEGVLTLEPWTFATETLTLTVEGRFVKQHTFDTDWELQKAYQTAPKLTKEVHLRPR